MNEIYDGAVVYPPSQPEPTCNSCFRIRSLPGNVHRASDAPHWNGGSCRYGVIVGSGKTISADVDPSPGYRSTPIGSAKYPSRLHSPPTAS